VRAVDANVLARFYLRDDAVQGRIAAAVLSAGDVFVPKTVMLELEWVLRYAADQPAGKVFDCLAHLVALPGVTVEDRDQVEAALDYARRGIDFADALHLAASGSCSELLTFDDRSYARRASKLGLKPAVRVSAA
jgi:predicted nucleic-acid-binding protein